MKKEITSFVIGAGIVGGIWTGTAFIKGESKSAVIESAQKIWLHSQTCVKSL